MTEIPTTPSTADVLIEARNITKTFSQPDGHNTTTVLENVSLSVYEGEVIAILGRSGSGKSTLLRILAGLVTPTTGEVISNGIQLHAPNPDVAMVFQSFALLPWLTVLQNVELGLQARGINRKARREQAIRMIDMIGLDGFEEAFPKELSGGMKQRVGFARALVVEPKILMMDEPFSALDILTSITLRQKVEELWNTRAISTKSIIVVTHSIDEAVALADRIIVLGTDPGRIRIEVKGLPKSEREKKSTVRSHLVDGLYRIMTSPDIDAEELLTPITTHKHRQTASSHRIVSHPRKRPQKLSEASVDNLMGFIQHLTLIGGAANLHQLAQDLQMRADKLFFIVEAAELLHFATRENQNVTLTQLGISLGNSALDEGKAIFRSSVMENVVLLAHMVKALETAPSHTIKASHIIKKLQHTFDTDVARRQFEIAVDWGRYAELFTYDTVLGEIKLDETHR